jgi:RNA polymerase sigma factor (sigma-70 family)
MLGSREEAEDVLQHVFLAVHRHLRDDDRPIQLKGWLYAVARNRCLSILRARREAVALDDVAEPSTDGLAIAAAVERRQDLQHLLGDLAGLPDDQRAALLLSELGDLSHDEIAAALDVRREKVKALVFQARESLMNSRRAREADCREIQAQLATLRGGALRRTTLRRHVAVCPSCAAFKAEVKRQTAALALVLPAVPSAVLKKSILAGVFGGGGGGGAAVVAGGAATAGGSGMLGSGLLTKGLAVAALAGGAGAGGVAEVRHLAHHPPSADAAGRMAPLESTAAVGAGKPGGLTPGGSISKPFGVAPAGPPSDSGSDEGNTRGAKDGRGHGKARSAKDRAHDVGATRPKAKAHGLRAHGSKPGVKREGHGLGATRRSAKGKAQGHDATRRSAQDKAYGHRRTRRSAEGEAHGQDSKPGRARGDSRGHGRRTRESGTSTSETSSPANHGHRAAKPPEDSNHQSPAKDGTGASPTPQPAPAFDGADGDKSPTPHAGARSS